MTAETREEKLERLAELRIQKRVHDLRYTEAENLQTYRTGFEDGYDFRREQDNEYASAKAEEGMRDAFEAGVSSVEIARTTGRPIHLKMTRRFDEWYTQYKLSQI